MFLASASRADRCNCRFDHFHHIDGLGSSRTLPETMRLVSNRSSMICAWTLAFRSIMDKASD